MSRRGISKLVKYLQPEDATGEDIRKFSGVVDGITKKEKVNIDRGFDDPWKDDVYDKNPLHYDLEVAKKAGYDDTPIYATMLAARLEQYVLFLLREINEVGGERLDYAGQQIDFKRPLYPEQEANWNLTKVIGVEEGIDLEISLVNEKGRPYFVCSGDEGKILGKHGGVRLRHKRREMPYKKIFDFLQNGKFITEDEKEIDEENLKSFYNCLGKSNRTGVPIMFPAAFIPATLWQYSVKQSGDPELTAGSIYKSMDLIFHNQPGIGMFKTIIRMPEDPVKNKKMPGYDYVFNTLCMQEGWPILSGKVELYSPFEFKFD